MLRTTRGDVPEAQVTPALAESFELTKPTESTV
jgi:hypothetical protein